MNKDERLKIALLILRLGLGGFLLLWSLDKLLVPEAAVGIFSHFYHLPLSHDAAYVVGGCEALLSLAIMAGFKRTATYAAGLGLHGVSTISSYSQLLHPFGKNHLFIAAIPILCGFVTLFMLREEDALCAVDARRS